MIDVLLAGAERSRGRGSRARGFGGVALSVAVAMVTLSSATANAAEQRASAEAEAKGAEATVERVTVESFDGTDLGGWLIRPANFTGKLPAILISSPYLGQCVAMGPCWPTPETPEDWAKHPEPIANLVEWGYAVGWFSVRGTGVSGGCWDEMGGREQRDQEVLVDWLAAQTWSNGRVGAMGLSYMAQTAMAAGARHPDALKTVVVSGTIGDLYSFFHTPQGLPFTYTVAPSEALYGADISLSPPGLVGGDADLFLTQAPQHYERACPEVARIFAEPTKGATTGMRDESYWMERRLTDDYEEFEASVLIAQGLLDLWGSGHQMQEDPMWAHIPTDKAMFTGQWGHIWPWQSGHYQFPPREDLKDRWLSTLRSWLDHFLKGGPKPAILNRALYEDESGTWRESKAWPPREARDEALYLGPNGTLAGEPPKEEWSTPFRSFPQFDRLFDPTAPLEPFPPTAFLCPALLDPATAPGSLVFATEPVEKRTVIAGNPMAYLDLASDQQGGGLQVTLHDIGPEFECSGDPTAPAPADARALTTGGADLRFHRGNFDPEPFSEGHVRIDIANIAAVLEPGHRLAMTVSYGDPGQYTEVGHTPLITVRSGPRVEASQLVVPVVKGGFGGARPKVSFPPRPGFGRQK